MENKTVELNVASDKDMLLIIRMTTAGVLSRAGLTLDDMDDMKLAVDEACSSIISQPTAYQRLHLKYDYAADKVSIEISGRGIAEGQSAPSSDASLENDELLRCILESMTDKVSIKRNGHAIEAIVIEKNISLSPEKTYGT